MLQDTTPLRHANPFNQPSTVAGHPPTMSGAAAVQTCPDTQHGHLGRIYASGVQEPPGQAPWSAEE